MPRMALLGLGLVLLVPSAWADSAAAPPAAPGGEIGLLDLVDEEVWQPGEVVGPPRDTSAQPLKRSPRENEQDAQVIGAGREQAATPGQSWLRTILSLAFVVALIVLLMWGYRALGGTSGRLALLGKARQPHLIEVVSRTPIGPKQALCLVRMGPRLLLVGVGPEQLRTLDVIDDPVLAAKLLGQATTERPDSQTVAFSRALETETTLYDEAEEDATPWDDRAEEASTPAQTQWATLLDSLRSRLRSAS